MSFYAHSTEAGDQHDWQLLEDHLEAVAALASVRAGRFGMAEAGRVAGLLHDLGKYSFDFQQRLQGAKKRVDHSTAGAVVARERFPGGVGDLLAYAIAGHHAGLANGRDSGERTPLILRLRAALPELSDEWQSALSLPDQLKPPAAFETRPDRGFFQLAFLTRMIFSCLVDADYLETEAFYARVTGEPVSRGGGPDLTTLRGALNVHLETFKTDS